MKKDYSKPIVHIRISKKQRAQLALICNLQGITMTEAVETVMTEYIASFSKNDMEKLFNQRIKNLK